MSERQTSRGMCVFCKQLYTGSGMGRHLQSCPARQAAIAAEQKARGTSTTLFHLYVKGTYAPLFWMHLELPATATLWELDRFLRDTWLECCGHLSAFTIEGTSYELDTDGIDAMWPEFFGQRERPRSMEVRLGSVLRPGLSFSHEYDFGSTTYLTLKVIAARKGVWRKQDRIRILARNELPDFRCQECGRPAVWIDTFGDYDLLCEECAGERDEEGFLPVVNSPRMGVCGYTGEAY